MHEPASPHVYLQSETPPTRIDWLPPINRPCLCLLLLHTYLLMAPRRLLFLLLSPLLIASLLLCFCFAAEPGISSGRTGRALLAYTAIDCVGLCGERCKSSSRPNLCKRACGTCCGRCSCVPPGTYGNYDSCPCYGEMTTHGGQRKCP